MGDDGNRDGALSLLEPLVFASTDMGSIIKNYLNGRYYLYNMNQNMNVRNPFKEFFLTDRKG